MKIVSFNVNGIRSAHKKGLADWIKVNNPDIICFQELKANVEDIPQEIAELSGYYGFWHPAQKKGYSGVGMLSRIQPRQVVTSFELEDYDMEGRMLLADFKEVSVMSAYFPSGTTGDIRQTFKEKFLSDFSKLIRKFRSEGKRLIITGDVNICHKPIDIHNPVSNKNTSGFLPHERAWVDDFLDIGYSDGLRVISDEPHQYTWWTFRANAREKNLGWRIDYHLIDKDLKELVLDYKIHSEVRMSDHCPIELRLKDNSLF
jgi:exodeoxyribonuclease-3